jgi:hypothetical protein
MAETTERSQMKVQVKADDATLRGAYANMANILHTKEEFVIDFLNIFPPNGTLNARVILSPAHFKRMVMAMTANLKKYEGQFGEVEPSAVKEETIVGFQER